LLAVMHAVRRTLTSVTVDAPREGRAKGRLGWLLRQLSDAPDDLRIEVAYPNARRTTSELLGAQVPPAGD
jgi:hypothetical protein